MGFQNQTTLNLHLFPTKHHCGDLYIQKCWHENASEGSGSGKMMSFRLSTGPCSILYPRKPFPGLRSLQFKSIIQYTMMPVLLMVLPLRVNSKAGPRFRVALLCDWNRFPHLGWNAVPELNRQLFDFSYRRRREFRAADNGEESPWGENSVHL